MHQGIARHGGLAKDSPTNLIRRDEPASGLVPSNAILRLGNPPIHTMLLQSKDIPYTLGGSFIGVFRSAFGLVFFLTVQARAGSLRFKPRVSCSPRLDKVSAKLRPLWIS